MRGKEHSSRDELTVVDDVGNFKIATCFYTLTVQTLTCAFRPFSLIL